MYKSWFLCNQTAKMCRQEVLLDKCVEAYRTNVHFMFSIHSQVTKWVVLLIRQNNTFCPPSKGSYIILESNNYNSCSLRYSTSPHYLGGQQPKLSTTPQPNLLLRKVNTTVTLIWSYRRRTPRLGTGGGAEKESLMWNKISNFWLGLAGYGQATAVAVVQGRRCLVVSLWWWNDSIER